ncbi:MAG: hypothetical protein ACFFDS_04390 [Candidatus Thorarchaeota archaeon]
MNRPLKITHSYEYTFDNNQVKLSLAKKSVLIPVFDQKNNQQIGFLLDGPLGIIADLVVHSEEGAVGEIIEETYSKVLFLPAELPFLSLDHVKEMSPLEEFQPYERLISDFNFQFSSFNISNHLKQKGILIQTSKPSKTWLITSDSTFLIGSREVIGRRGEMKLIWVGKKEIIFVNEKGRVKSTKDFLSLKKARDLFQRVMDIPYGSIFSSFRDLLTST